MPEVTTELKFAKTGTKAQRHKAKIIFDADFLLLDVGKTRTDDPDPFFLGSKL